MDQPPDDPTVRDLFAPPPLPTAAELGQGVAVLVDGGDAVQHLRPDYLSPASAAHLAGQIVQVFELVGFALHGGGPTGHRAVAG